LAPGIVFLLYQKGRDSRSEDIGGLSNERAIEKIGLLIDVSDDLKRDAGTTRALAWCDTLEHCGVSNSEAVLLEYFRANAWANRHSKRHGDIFQAQGRGACRTNRPTVFRLFARFVRIWHRRSRSSASKPGWAIARRR
jgi:hypothetical protein